MESTPPARSDCRLTASFGLRQVRPPPTSRSAALAQRAGGPGRGQRTHAIKLRVNLDYYDYWIISKDENVNIELHRRLNP